MARQRMSAPGGGQSQSNVPPEEPTGPVTPAQPTNVPPQIWANDQEVTFLNYRHGTEGLLVQGTWEDLDLVSDPTFTVSVAGQGTAEFLRFDARSGTSGTWTVRILTRPQAPTIPDILTVTITDDRGESASVDVTVKLQYDPFMKTDDAKQIVTWDEGDTDVITGTWNDLDRGTSTSAAEPTTLVVTPNEGSPSFSATPTPLAGTWQVAFTSITLEQAGDYEIVMIDSDGNASEPATFRINVNPTTPNVLPTISATLSGSPLKTKVAFAGSPISVAGTWTDADNTGNVTIEEVTGTIGSISVPSPGATSGSFTWDVTEASEEQEGYIQFKITDADGAEAYDGFYLFIVPVAPQLTASPLLFDVAEGTVITSNLTWSDGDGIETGGGTAKYKISPAIGSIDPVGTGTVGTNVYTSPALTNADHDGISVDISIEDASGRTSNTVTLEFRVRAPATNIPPTIDAPQLQADSLGLAQYQVRLNEGFPAVISGIWGDEDASGVKPVASITSRTTFDGLPFGTIDPLPGSPAFESTSGVWQISTSSHNAAHHNAILEVTITDDDGLTNTITIRLDLVLDDDPLRLAVGHPSPALGAYWTAASSLHFAEDPRGEIHGGGILLDTQVAPSPIILESTGTAVGGKLNVYRPQFVAYAESGITFRAQVHETEPGGSPVLTQDVTIEGPLNPVGVPTATIDTPFEPLLTKVAGQDRAGLFASVHYKAGTYRCYYTVDVTGGTRDLYQTSSSDPTTFPAGTLLRSAVENVVVEDSGSGGLKMVGTERLSGGGLRVFEGTSSNLTDWSFSVPTQPSTPGYPIGDLICSVNSKHIIKAHGWSDSTYGYRRHFFHEGQELQGLRPADPAPNPLTGLPDTWYDTYGLSIFRPADHGWSSSYEYVAIQWLFHITSTGSTRANQIGNIIPVWAVSDDLVNWSLPFGVEPVFPIQSWYSGMVLHATNPIAVNNELLMHYSGHSYEHNQFNRNDPSQVVGIGLGRITRSQFESAFSALPVMQLLSTEGAYSITLGDIDLTTEGKHAKVSMWCEQRPALPPSLAQPLRVLLEKSLFERVPKIEPPPTGDLVFNFNRQITQAQADALLVAGSDFAITGSGRLYSLDNNNRLSMGNNRALGVPINFIAPERNSDGSFKCHISLDSRGKFSPPQYESHCMVRPFVSSVEGVFNSGIYTKEGQAYRWDLELYMSPGQDWLNTNSAIVFQLHPGSFPGSFSSKNPWVALDIKNAEWRGLVRGSDEVTPTEYTQIIDEREPFAPGLNSISVECRIDPLDEFGTGGSYCYMSVNGKRFLEVKNGPIGINHSALGASKPQAAATVGYYGSIPESLPDPLRQPWVDVREIKVYRL